MTPEAIKAIEYEFDELYLLPQDKVLIKSFFFSKLIALLEEDVERLEGGKHANDSDWMRGFNNAIDQEIAHRRTAINSLKSPTNGE